MYNKGMMSLPSLQKTLFNVMVNATTMPAQRFVQASTMPDPGTRAPPMVERTDRF